MLRVFLLKGGVFLRGEITARWCIFSQVTWEDRGSLLECAEYILLYDNVANEGLIMTAQIPNRKPGLFLSR